MYFYFYQAKQKPDNSEIQNRQALVAMNIMHRFAQSVSYSYVKSLL